MSFQLGFMDCHKTQNVIQLGFIKSCFKITSSTIGLMEYYTTCKNVISTWILIVCVLSHPHSSLMHQSTICNTVRQTVEQCFESSLKVKTVCYSSSHYWNETLPICTKVDNNHTESTKRKIYWYPKILNYHLKWYLYVQFNHM